MARTKSASATQKVVTHKDDANENQAINTVAEEPAKRKEIKVKQLDPHDYVTVKNGFAGKLVYISKRTGERFVWQALGDEQDMELQELKNARNASKGFFENNWFLFDDPAVIEYLGVERMYKNALSANEFSGLFDKTPDEIEAVLSKVSNGQRASLAYFARQKILNHEIDSLRVIKMLEKYLGVQLIEN